MGVGAASRRVVPKRRCRACRPRRRPRSAIACAEKSRLGRPVRDDAEGPLAVAEERDEPGAVRSTRRRRDCRRRRCRPRRRLRSRARTPGWAYRPRRNCTATREAALPVPDPDVELRVAQARRRRDDVGDPVAVQVGDDEGRTPQPARGQAVEATGSSRSLPAPRTGKRSSNSESEGPAGVGVSGEERADAGVGVCAARSAFPAPPSRVALIRVHVVVIVVLLVELDGRADDRVRMCRSSTRITLPGNRSTK